MKKTFIIIFATITLLSTTSCIKDDSIGEVNPISKIEMTGELDSIYSLERWDTLRINLPEIKQTEKDKPLSYSWEINYNEVSTEKDLVYVCDKFGKFSGRLKISNEDGFLYKKFNIDVRYSYIQGLYILASLDNKTIVSYLPEDIKGKNFELDVYEKNNPQIALGSEPKAFFFTNTPEKEQVYIATANPSMLYRLNANMMTILDKITVDPFISFITDDGVGSAITNIRFMINNRVAEMSYKNSYITNPRQQYIEGMFGKVKLFRKFYYWRTPDNRYTNGELYFDNLQSRLIIYSGSASPALQELFKNEFSNMDMIDLCLVNNKQEFGAILKDKTTNEFIHVWFNPGYYNKYNIEKQIAPEIKFNAAMPTSSHINEKSVITSSPAKNIMYYTSGNKVFAYSVLSKGNFPTQPLFVCGDEGTISSMLVNEAEDKLYIGVNNKKQKLQGSIFCYDINSNKLIWKKENITGKIIQLDYKLN